MAKKFSELRKKMPPAARARAEKATRALLHAVGKQEARGIVGGGDKRYRDKVSGTLFRLSSAYAPFVQDIERFLVGGQLSSICLPNALLDGFNPPFLMCEVFFERLLHEMGF